jgi:hypothetical protein
MEPGMGQSLMPGVMGEGMGVEEEVGGAALAANLVHLLQLSEAAEQLHEVVEVAEQVSVENSSSNSSSGRWPLEGSE